MIEIKSLSVKYEKKVVLDDISFHVKRGDYLAIVGENGSGKSTLMKTMLGLKAPSGGTVSLGEFEQIGYLPQLDESQESFPARVKEIVAIGLLNKIGGRFFYNKRELKRVDEVMDMLKISDLKNRYFGALSGGQRQRVLLARALVASSDILFLDEPTTGLDPIATAEFYETIDELNENGTTIIIISHDINTICRCARSVLHINKNVLFFGDKEDYIRTDYFKALSGVHIHV